MKILVVLSYLVFPTILYTLSCSNNGHIEENICQCMSVYIGPQCSVKSIYIYI